MPLTPVTVEQFRGLRLNAEQGEAAGAIDMLNVDLPRGYTQIGARGGMTLATTGTANISLIAATHGATRHTMVLFRYTGAAVSVVEWVPGSGISGASTWGGATTRVTSTASAAVGEQLWIASSTTSGGNTGVRVYDIAAASITSTAAYMPRFLAATPDGRLAQAHYNNAADTPSGANGSPSTVFFSDPDDFSTYGSTNWIELDPDDGDEITGMVQWHNTLFVSKTQAIFVFGPPGIDTTGNPLFEYRRIDLPANARKTSTPGTQTMVAGSDGVYLLLADGIYRTVGDRPVRISDDITPLFDGTGDATMLVPDSGGSWTFSYAINRLYLTYTVGSTYRTLVYDTQLREWLLWDLSAGQSVQPSNVLEFAPIGTQPSAYVAAAAKVLSLSKTATSDDGAAIVSRYQPGFDGLGSPSQEKKIRSIEVVGSGSPTLTVLADYATSDPLSRQATVTLGTAPDVAGATHAKSYRGRLLSPKLSASSGAWTVDRLTWNVQSVRAPGLRSA